MPVGKTAPRFKFWMGLSPRLDKIKVNVTISPDIAPSGSMAAASSKGLLGSVGVESGLMKVEGTACGVASGDAKEAKGLFDVDNWEYANDAGVARTVITTSALSVNRTRTAKRFNQRWNIVLTPEGDRSLLRG